MLGASRESHAESEVQGVRERVALVIACWVPSFEIAILTKPPVGDVKRVSRKQVPFDLPAHPAFTCHSCDQSITQECCVQSHSPPAIAPTSTSVHPPESAFGVLGENPPTFQSRFSR